MHYRDDSIRVNSIIAASTTLSAERASGRTDLPDDGYVLTNRSKGPDPQAVRGKAGDDYQEYAGMNGELLRRAHDRVHIEMEPIDDEDPRRLTLSEIKELKRLAHMSRTARAVMIAVMALISLVGLPALMDFLRAHWK